MTAVLEPIAPAILPTDTDGTLGVESAGEEFEDSFAATILRLRNEDTAPPLIVWQPLGAHCIYPEGAAGMVYWRVEPKIAAIGDRDLQAMRRRFKAGRGQEPRITLGHDGPFAGSPLQIYWDPRRGVTLRVAWLPTAERAIVEGDSPSFSPVWARSGDNFLGLMPTVGALLSRSERPAFLRMPRIQPISRWRKMELEADLFLRAVDQRCRAMSQAEFPALQGFEAVKTEWPELHRAYALRQAVNGRLRENREL